SRRRSFCGFDRPCQGPDGRVGRGTSRRRTRDRGALGGGAPQERCWRRGPRGARNPRLGEEELEDLREALRPRALVVDGALVLDVPEVLPLDEAELEARVADLARALDVGLRALLALRLLARPHVDPELDRRLR